MRLHKRAIVKRRSKLPLLFVLAGILLGLALALMWAYISVFNPFHLPTVEQAQTLGNYTAPPLYWHLRTLLIILLPGIWLDAFAMGASQSVHYTIWGFAILLDGAIFYCIGLLVNRMRRVLVPQGGDVKKDSG